MKTRLQYIVNNEGLSNNKFAAEIGISPAAVTHIISGRNNPSLDIISKIAMRYPQYRLRWLILGELPILNQAERETAPSINLVEEDSQRSVQALSVRNAVTNSTPENSTALEQDLPFDAPNNASEEKYAQDKRNESQNVTKENEQGNPTGTKCNHKDQHSCDKLIVCLPDGTFQEYTKRSN